jgi:glycosyltransferase involved in cell wall biosynthesis
MPGTGELEMTVLICTHNRADLLRHALEAVARLKIKPGRQWEVVVIQNNCSDSTGAVLEEFARDQRFPVLRIANEERQGVAFARKLGFRLSRGSLIGLVDDDCQLDEDWLEEAIDFANTHPRAGAFGGCNELEWQKTPDELCLAYGESLARQNLGDLPYQLPSHGRETLCGAGLVIRRQAIEQCRYVETGILIGRSPETLGAGEDAEICFSIRNAGWEIWYAPALKLRHYIPAARMQLSYLKRLHRGFGRAETCLQLLAQRRPPNWLGALHGMFLALQEWIRVILRFPMGYLFYRNERPSWVIRWHYAIGCLEGAIGLMNLRRNNKRMNQGANAGANSDFTAESSCSHISRSRL